MMNHMEQAIEASIASEQERLRTEQAVNASFISEQERLNIEQAVNDSIALEQEKCEIEEAVQKDTDPIHNSYLLQLSDEEQMKYLIALSSFDASGKIGDESVLENPMLKPVNTKNLGGDLILTLDDGTSVHLVQQCFVYVYKNL